MVEKEIVEKDMMEKGMVEKERGARARRNISFSNTKHPMGQTNGEGTPACTSLCTKLQKQFFNGLVLIGLQGWWGKERRRRRKRRAKANKGVRKQRKTKWPPKRCQQGILCQLLRLQC